MFRWRKTTWALIVFSVFMGWWFVVSLQGAAHNCAHTAADQLAACQVGTGIGASFVAFIIGVLWFIGFIVLALIWLMSRPSKRLCPQCGRDVPKGLTSCLACGYSFLQAPIAITMP